MPGAIGRHFRRYPFWYSMVIVFVVAIVVLPTIEGGSVAPRRIGGRTTGAVATPSTSPGDVATIAAPAALPFAPVSSPAAGGTPVAPKPKSAPSASTPAPAEDAALFHLAPPPAIPLPSLPTALTPLLAAIAPITSTGCSVVGLAAVAIAAGGSLIAEIPLTDLGPYLVPAYTACALVPQPITHTRCPIDAQIAAQLPPYIVALYPIPSILGIGIDEVAAVENMIATLTQVPSNGVAASLAAALDCTTD